MKYCPVCGRESETEARCPEDGAVMIPVQPEAEALVGQVLEGSYRIDEKIGEGGMGVVFRGVQMALQRTVAIKVLLPEMRSTPSMVRRFFQEAKLLSQLNHPHVVGIIDFGSTESGTLYMVMEFLEGRTLREVVAEDGGLPLGRAVRLMQQICAAVGTAHDSQLVHRDLKPDNIFIAARQSSPEAVKVLDFGLARAVADANDTRLTQTGLLIGTAGFVAPEQISGGDADERSDVYALGAILYYMITGQLPYRGSSLHGILTAQLREPPDVETGSIAAYPGLGRIVLRAMAADPADRFSSPGELFTALNQAASELDPSLSLGVGAAWAAAPKTELSPYRREEAGRKGPSRAPTSGGHPPSEHGGSPRSPLWMIGALLVVLVVLGARWLWFGAGSTADPAAVPETGPVLVGMSAAFSGPSRELGRGMKLGIDTHFAEVNAQGGVGGRELELVALDDGYEPAQTVANMTELLFERRVTALLGNVGTPTTEVALPLALEQEVPFFGAFTGAALLRREPPDRLVFNFRASYAEETRAIIHHFVHTMDFAPDEVAVFAQDDAFGDEGYRGVVRALAERGHDGEVPRFGYRRNTQSIRSAVEGLTAEGSSARGVVLVATYRAAAELIRQSRAAGSDLTFAGLSFVGSNAFAEELAELGPALAEGVIVTQVVPHFGSDLPGVARYRELLATHFPAERPGFVSLEGYLAARVLVEALRGASPDLSGPSIAAATEAIGELDLGIGAEVRYGPDRHQGSRTVWVTVLDRSGDFRPLETPSG